MLTDQTFKSAISSYISSQDNEYVIGNTTYNKIDTPIGSWDVSSVTDMSRAFAHNIDFNENLQICFVAFFFVEIVTL